MLVEYAIAGRPLNRSLSRQATEGWPFNRSVKLRDFDGSYVELVASVLWWESGLKLHVFVHLFFLLYLYFPAFLEKRIEQLLYQSPNPPFQLEPKAGLWKVGRKTQLFPLSNWLIWRPYSFFWPINFEAGWLMSSLPWSLTLSFSDWLNYCMGWLMSPPFTWQFNFPTWQLPSFLSRLTEYCLGWPMSLPFTQRFDFPTWQPLFSLLDQSSVTRVDWCPCPPLNNSSDQLTIVLVDRRLHLSVTIQFCLTRQRFRLLLLSLFAIFHIRLHVF